MFAKYWCSTIAGGATVTVVAAFAVGDTVIDVFATAVHDHGAAAVP